MPHFFMLSVKKSFTLLAIVFMGLLQACGGGSGGEKSPQPNVRAFVLAEDTPMTFSTEIDSCDELWVLSNPENGQVYCNNNEFTYQPNRDFWGDDDYEYRSNQDATVRRVTFEVSQQAADQVAKVIIAEDAFCALLTSQTVQCFGAPRLASLLENAQQSIEDISAGYSPLVGYSHVCTLANNTVTCNGYGADLVPTLYNPTALYGAGLYNCALHDYGLACWGELGHIVVPSVSNPSAVAAGSGHLCVLDTGVLSCTGSDSGGNFVDARTQVPVGLVPVAVAAGDTSTCAISNGQVVCWGYFSDSSANLNAADITPDDFSAPIAIASGRAHACAIDDSGLRCWGIDRFGRLDPPTGLVNPRAVYIHGDSSCVLDDYGLQCWRDAYSLYSTDVPGNLYSQP